MVWLSCWATACYWFALLMILLMVLLKWLLALVSLIFAKGNALVLLQAVAARDGIAEVEMLSMPADGKIRIRYEYIFRNEAETMSDEELKTVFKDLSTVPMKAMAEIPVKVNPSKRTMVMKPGNDAATNSVATNDMVKPELTEEKEMKIQQNEKQKIYILELIQRELW